MPFRPFPFRKKTRETRLATSSDQFPTSRPIVCAPDDDTIQMSLVVLFEGTSFAGKLPYISSFAGLLLQVLSMREEVKHYKEECKVLERKLARVASIVANVGELCERYNLNEEDLPVSLRTTLHSHLRDLDGIQRVVKQCTKMKGIKRLLLRNNLRTKIRHYDGELSNALQAFQAVLSLDIRFALLTEKREVTSPSGRAEAISITSGEPNDSRTFSGIKSGWDDLCSEPSTPTALSTQSALPRQFETPLVLSNEIRQAVESPCHACHGPLSLYSLISLSLFFFFPRVLMCHWHRRLDSSATAVIRNIEL